MRLFKIFTLLLLMLSLSSCGFRLRGFLASDGTGHLPFSIAYVQGTGGVADALRRQLAAFTDMHQPASAEEAQVRITLLQEQIEQKILTINSTGQVSEYRVYLTIHYRIQYHNDILLDNAQARTFRDYSYNDSAVLGKELEQNMLIRDMYQDAASQLLQRATALVKNTQHQAKQASDIAASPMTIAP